MTGLLSLECPGDFSIKLYNSKWKFLPFINFARFNFYSVCVSDSFDKALDKFRFNSSPIFINEDLAEGLPRRDTP